jgi:3-hydroxybutyryl-CoA dehydratase
VTTRDSGNSQWSSTIHIDPEFAARTTMGGIIAHGTMSLGLMWQMIDLNLASGVSDVCMTIRFVSPVRPGDRIAAGGQPVPERKGRHEVWVRNQKGETVISGHIETAHARADSGEVAP